MIPPFFLLYWKQLVFVAAIGFVTLWYNLHVDRLVREGAAKAVTARDSEWRTAEQAAIDKSKAEAAAKEAEQRKQLKTIQDQAQKDLADAKLQRERDLAAARAGSLSLRIPAKCPSTANVPGTPTSTSGGDGTAFTELPREVTANLYTLANDADEVVRQLGRCQDVTNSDRKVSK